MSVSLARREVVRQPIAVRLTAVARARGAPLVGFDSSGAQSVLCLVDLRPGVVEELMLPSSAAPSESLAAQLHAELATASLTAGALGGIVVGLGPGSFTGVRVSLALAKGLALGAPIPVVGVSSLAALAGGAGPGRVLTVRDARHGEWFSAVYDVSPDGESMPVLADAVRSPTSLRHALVAPPAGAFAVVGDVASEAVALLGPGFTTGVRVAAPSLAGVMLGVAERLAAGDGDPLEALAPCYLRASEPERKLETAPSTRR